MWVCLVGVAMGTLLRPPAPCPGFAPAGAASFFGEISEENSLFFPKNARVVVEDWGRVPPAGFEPARMAPEATALSPELRGPGRVEGNSDD